ncbi:zinc finger RNA-binding protein-like, partial [Lingula anatina]|uniref:Zinc finger RNA-binding protein-like n=1 Tax=Lingula anatina TaxID=7574 RepID=A0A2R2MQT2_LINAN
MANNYFGFTQGATHYTAQPAAYPAAQTAYVHQAAPAAYATAATPRPTYETYQTAATTQYAYATRTPVIVNPNLQVNHNLTPVVPAAATYDTTKTYYQPAAQPAYTVATETHYQTSKPAYSGATTYASQPRVQTSAQKSASTYVYPASGATTTQSTTSYTSTPAYATTTSGATYSAGYDAALYSAATNYYQQQQAAKTGTTYYKKGPTTTFQKKDKKVPPKQPQLHYCDVCKISCAGPQTYREHLEGQKHKKKEAAMKGTTQPTGRPGQNQLRCELCDVACTGADAYAAHIRGAKHQKVLKLHTKLGKPIPSTEPTVVTLGAGNATTATTVKVVTSSQATAVAAAPVPTASAKTVTKTIVTATGTKKVLATPKITFVGGSQLKTTGTKMEEVKPEPVMEPKQEVPTESSTASLSSILGEKDVQPVGHEYIEEVKNEQGKTISFNCKLCECKFNDPNAKEMHMKGRRHRLQYKKKVDPKLEVDVKPSNRNFKKLQKEKMKFQQQRTRNMMMEEERYWEERRRYEEEMEFWQNRMGRGGPFTGPPMPMRRPDTSDDRHVMAKHASIYPNEQELQAVQSIVSTCEKALKLVSDAIAESDNPRPAEAEKLIKTEKKDEKEAEAKEGDKEDDPNQPPRALKGVMRVGVLAKGLLLRGNLNVQLVVLCSEKPTRTLLERVADVLPKQMATVTDEKYEVKICVEEAGIIVSSASEPETTCTVTLTSPIMRENAPEGETVSVKDPPDVLDRQKCLDALAALRHAKWF